MARRAKSPSETQPEHVTRPAAAGVLALEQLVEMITSGEFGSGDRLPTERDLSHRLGFSRGTLREAIRSLELVGVLDSRQGDGTYVQQLDSGLVLGATGFVSQLFGDEDVLEMFEVRAVLESAAASLAASRSTPEALEQLRCTVDGMLAAVTPEAYVEADIAFHSLIGTLAGNKLLAALIESFSVRTHPVRLYTQLNVAQADYPSPAGLSNEHVALLDAIVNRDPIGAAAAAVAHARIAGTDWVRIHGREAPKDGPILTQQA